MLLRTALAVGLVGLFFFVMPFPLRTVAEGITWPSERSQIRAGTDGFIERLVVANGSQVELGQPLIKAYDPFLDTRVAVLEAQLRGLRRQYTAVRTTDQAEAAVLLEEINGVRSDLERARERQRELVINSPRAGMFVVPVEQDMPGRFVKKGQLVGFVIDASDRLTARTMVDQYDVALVRERTRGVDVIPVHWEGRSAAARVIREVPEGLKTLPTPALGTTGGGTIPIDPRDSKGVTALDRYFEYEIALPAVDDRAFIGQRVKVRFDHGTEPIGFQVYRLIRQVFLRLFDV